MDKSMTLIQLLISVIILISLTAWGIASLINGTIGISGFCVVLLFIFLSWMLVGNSYREYREENDK